MKELCEPEDDDGFITEFLAINSFYMFYRFYR